MKKPTPKLRLRLIRLAQYQKNRNSKRRVRNYVHIRNKFVKPGEIIKAPVRFNLTRGAGIEVVKFLKAVAHTVLKLHKPVRLNFKDTEAFFVPGAILLYAELNRIILESDLPKPITIINPFRQKPREVLKQIELHQLTGDNCEVVPTKDDVVFWKIKKGANQSGGDLGPILEYVADCANKEHAKKVEVSGIWRGVSEAVSNVVDHAYEIPRKDGFAGLNDTKWWMFTQIREERFTAAVCDLGCGYINTIKRNIEEAFLSKIYGVLTGKNEDALAIQAAMEYGRSGTKLSNRGKGSRDALSVLIKHGSGQLFILSKSGWVQYKINGNKEKIETGDLGIDIGGTIIWWTLPLKDENNDES